LVEGRQLVMQAAEHFKRSGLTVGIEMADRPLSTNEQVVVASIDSFVRRLDRFKQDDFGVVLVDECHHILAHSYLKVLDHLGFRTPEGREKSITKARLVGLTATPDRGDKRNIMSVFDELAFEYPIERAIDDGWLVPIKSWNCVLDGLDLSSVRKTAGDLNMEDLLAALDPLIEPMAKEIVEIAGSMPTIIFSPLVVLAEKMTELITSMAPTKRCETITGDTKDRARMFADFTAGATTFLSSVGTLTEGVDLPVATVGGMCRMTRVRALYAQMVGRLLRLPPGVDHLPTAEERKAAIAASVKPCAIVIDFAGNNCAHKLVTALDLFTGDCSDEVRAKAQELMEGGETNPGEAVAAALAEIARMEAEMRGKAMQRVLVDPFKTWDLPDRDPWDPPATPAQLNAIVQAGIMGPLVDSRRARGVTLTPEQKRLAEYKAADMTFGKRSASAMLSRLDDRRRQDLATAKQVVVLVSKGVQMSRAMLLTYAQAREAIDGLAAAAWKPTTEWVSKWAAKV